MKRTKRSTTARPSGKFYTKISDAEVMTVQFVSFVFFNAQVSVINFSRTARSFFLTKLFFSFVSMSLTSQVLTFILSSPLLHLTLSLSSKQLSGSKFRGTTQTHTLSAMCRLLCGQNLLSEGERWHPVPRSAVELEALGLPMLSMFSTSSFPLPVVRYCSSETHFRLRHCDRHFIQYPFQSVLHATMEKHMNSNDIPAGLKCPNILNPYVQAE